MRAPKVTPFQPGAVGTPLPAPDWDAFAPPAPGALGRVFGGAARYARQVTEAQARHDAAMAQHVAGESARQRALAVAKAEYDRNVAAEPRGLRSLTHEWPRDRKTSRRASPRPLSGSSRACSKVRAIRNFPRTFQVAYLPENRDVVVSSNCPAKGLPRAPGLQVHQDPRRN